MRIFPGSACNKKQEGSALLFVRLQFAEETVHRFAAVGFSCLRDRLGPVAVVDGIGPELGLQSDAGAFSIVDAAFAGFVQEIAGIELDAGAVGIHRHGTAGSGIRKNGTGIAENLPVVVVAALQFQRLVIGADIPADGLGTAEIHGSKRDVPELSGGDIFRIIGIEEPAGNGENLIYGAVRLFLTRQIEVAVVGQIENGIPVADCFIGDVQPAGIVQPVGDPDHCVAGEALIPLGTLKLQRNGIFGVGQHLPHPLVEKVRAAVEVVVSFVGGQGIDNTADLYGGTLNPVCVPADDGAQKRAVRGAVAVAVVIAKHHVRHVAHGVGNQQIHKSPAVIGDGGRQSTAGYGVQIGLLAGGKNAEKFFHGKAPHNVSWNKASDYVKRGFLDYIIICP